MKHNGEQKTPNNYLVQRPSVSFATILKISPLTRVFIIKKHII